MLFGHCDVSWDDRVLELAISLLDHLVVGVLLGYVLCLLWLMRTSTTRNLLVQALTLGVFQIVVVSLLAQVEIEKIVFISPAVGIVFELVQ